MKTTDAMKTTVDVGKCIKVAQMKRGIRSDHMARDFSVAKQQVYRWRNSEDMSVHKAAQFAEYFRMGLGEFLSLGD